MVEPNHNGGRSRWRAGCSGTGTSGSGCGPQKRTSRKNGTAAARSHTYVSTWSGWCYTAFVIDAYARRILGWSVVTTTTSQLVVDAVEQAV